MSVLDWLNNLAAAGLLSPLYNANVVTVRSYAYREIVLYYTALAETEKYAKDPGGCAKKTAEECGVDLATVYRARKAMGKQVKGPLVAAG